MHGDENFESLKDIPKVLTKDRQIKLLKQEVHQLQKQVRDAHIRIKELLEEKTNR